MALLILPVGPPGCGKSTLARQLIELGCFDPDAVISTDDLRVRMTGCRDVQLFNGQVFQVARLMWETRLRNNLSTYLDATNITTFLQMIPVAHDLGAIAVCIRFALSLDELLKRNAVRAHPVPDDVLARMHDDFSRIPLEQYPVATITPTEALAWAKRGWLS